MANFSLLDVVTPYVLGGAAIGDPLHELLTVLFVQDVETAFDDSGVVVSGMARFSVDVTSSPLRYTPPFGFSFDATGTADHRTVRRAGAFWDFPDIAIRFRLTAPRTSSPVANLVVNGSLGNPPAPPNVAVRNVLTGLDLGAPPADAPGTLFQLDLLIDAATLHLPFLTPAMLGGDGMLTPDPTIPEVTVTLPKIKLSFVQTAGAVAPNGTVTDPDLTVALDSWAAQDIDDPAGTQYAELIKMTPPYALIGPGDVIGFGFHSLVLDLSGTVTPPELLTKFGVGDDFRGIYLPDTRVFVKFPGLSGLSVDVSARELLIGIGPEGGVSGIFGLDVVLPDQPPSATITVYDELGQLITRLEAPEDDPWTAPAVQVPAKSQWVVDVTGGQPPYKINIDGTDQGTDPVWVALTTQSKNVAITISDDIGQSQSITVPVVLATRSLTGGTGTEGAAQPAKLNVVTAGSPGYSITMLDSPAAEKVTLVFNPPDPATVALDGDPGAITVTDGRATIDLAHGEKPRKVEATWSQQGGIMTLPAQFQYDEPNKSGTATPQNPNDPAWAAFADVPSNIRTIRSDDESGPNGGWTEPDHFLIGSTELADFVAVAKDNPDETITLVGMASKEHWPNPLYNLELSRRRVWALRELLAAQEIPNKIEEKPQGEQPPTDPYLKEKRSFYRRVEATLNRKSDQGSTTVVELSRPARPPAPVPLKPTVSKREAVGNKEGIQFKEFHVRVEISHNRVIAIEARLKVDVETVLESHLKRVKQQNPDDAEQDATKLPVRKKANPDDGTLDLRVQLTWDDTVDRWHMVASLFENDPDGLLQTPPPNAAEGSDNYTERYWRSVFGVMIALVPLLDASAASNTVAGDLVAGTIAHTVPFAVVGMKVVSVQRITLYGGELVLAHDATGTRGALLLDVEVAMVVVLKIGNTNIIDTKPDNPITVRYKAIGFRTSDQPQLRDLVPVFDSSKGYTINVPSTGGIAVPDPLGDILQVAATRIARSNPVNLELDIELKADLGVVSVDKTTIRIPFEEGLTPTLSALGVHIDIPGAIEGHGYLAIYEDGFAGQLDVSLPGIGVRVAAGLSVRNIVDGARSATAIMLTLEVDFPVPIALGSSGLGIYGFGGLFALHHKRKENPNAPVPALDWLQNVVKDGNPLDIGGWGPDIDRWSIGLGAVLGTMDGGFTLNVKGMLIFEMPGPRILLVMKANLLAMRPGRQGKVTATILAVIDVDLGRGRISIGLSFDYEIDPLLSIHVPVRAIFPFEDETNFAIDAGTWYSPATVEFFKLFTARGYFMIRGNGIPNPDYDGDEDPPFDSLGGFAIATGASTSYLWGNKGDGLYLSVGSSFDVGLGFSPIRFSGTMRLWGELHLWIIGIEAAARLSLTAGQVEVPGKPGETKSLVLIDGEVHGSIDLFFFTLEGSVHVTLGDQPGSQPEPPELVTGVSLQSRAAALLTGISSDRPIDGKLVDAHHGSVEAPLDEAVPIDAIIVVHFDCTPRVQAGAAFGTTQDSNPVAVAIGTPVGPAAPAVRRGEPYYTYRITGVFLDNGLTEGATPIVWWPTQANPGSESKRELALLCRVPDPHPSAVERSKHQKDHLIQVWGTLCDEVAPATSVLWTFHDEPLGPSPVGWVLPAGIPWPAPPGSTRSQPPNLRLDVAETWRSGNAAADLLIDISPARVVGGYVACDPSCEQEPQPQPQPPPQEQISALVSPSTELAGRFQLAAATTGNCRARVLEAPFLRVPDLVALAQHPLGPVLVKLFKEAQQKRTEPLDDIVAFATGEIVSVRLLLLVPEQVLKAGALILRSFAAAGAILSEVKIDGTGPSRIVKTSADLPATWWDPVGPWRCRVAEVITYLTGANHLKEGYRLVLVDTTVESGTAYLQTGLANLSSLLDQPGSIGRPSYLIGVVETLTAAEVQRHDTDYEMQQHQVTEINGALAGMQAPPALLLPNTNYHVTVSYEWTTCNADGSGVKDWEAETQTFSFRTDGEPLKPNTVIPPTESEDQPKPVVMPVRLDPWVLLTDPEEDEHFFFWGNPIRVVFSVDYLLNMFEAYGVQLEGRVRAASNANADNSQTFPDLVAVDLVATDLQPVVNAAVFTPWEDTMRDIVGDVVRPLKCVESFGDTSRQTVLNLNLLLGPRCDYIFDIEPANAPSPAAGAVRPLFRRKFSTSRYEDPKQMCADVAAAVVREFPATAAAVAGLLALVGAPNPIAGSVLDAALRQAGLRPVLEVTNPEVEVVWVPGNTGLQPRVLVIRTPEPLVRTRRQPDEYEPSGQLRLQRKVIRLVDKPYLDIVPSSSLPDAQPLPNAPTLHIVSQPGLSTVVVVVDEGRDKPIGLHLHEYDNPFLGEGSDDSYTELLHLQLDAATWEVG